MKPRREKVDFNCPSLSSLNLATLSSAKYLKRNIALSITTIGFVRWAVAGKSFSDLGQDRVIQKSVVNQQTTFIEHSSCTQKAVLQLSNVRLHQK